MSYSCATALRYHRVRAEAHYVLQLLNSPSSAIYYADASFDCSVSCPRCGTTRAAQVWLACPAFSVIEPHGLQLVLVWVEYERTVVAEIVVGPIPRWPIAGPAGRHSRAVELIYSAGIWSVKRNVNTTTRVRCCATEGYVCPEFGEV